MRITRSSIAHSLTAWVARSVWKHGKKQWKGRRIVLVVGLKDYKICNISAGASSFIAGWIVKDTIDEWIYLDIDDQHEDSTRFIKDCEKAIGKPITIIRNEEYRNVEECARVAGAFRNIHNNFYPCSNWLKKRVRKNWEIKHKELNITYVLGFDFSEKERAGRMVEHDPDHKHEFPLIERMLTKEDAHGMLDRLGIKRPAMYDMGYPNNNCIGCVRGGMGYWNNIRRDFPEVFASRAKLERDIGHSILKQCYLDELEPDRGNMNTEIFPDCTTMCVLTEIEIGNK